MESVAVNTIGNMFEYYRNELAQKAAKVKEELDEYERHIKAFEGEVEVNTARHEITIRDVDYWGKSNDKRVILSKLENFVKLYNKINKLKVKHDKYLGIDKLKEFRFIINTFNNKAVEHMIQGHVLEMPRAGRLFIKRVKRPSGKGKADLFASGRKRYELLEDGLIPKCPEAPNGHDWIVLYTAPYWPQVFWRNKGINVIKAMKEKFVFEPTHKASNNTFVSRIHKALKIDPHLMVKYIR